MTTEEIQNHIHGVLEANFKGLHMQSGEMMTSEGGDGRFLGKVIASLYTGFPGGEELYLAIGKTEHQTQIIKFGNSECLQPSKDELDMLMLKELGIKMPDS
ncbi:MAG: hypothetical protein ACO3SO_07720 [Luteolibacter sp.]|jgi:hypothetical protein